MKKILILLLVCFAFVGCVDRIDVDKGYKKAVGYGSGASVIIVNDCQYVIYQGSNNGDFAMVHAGNCNNPQHQTSLK